MKALSIVSPGGALIASGSKTLEVRRWAPDIRPDDDLLIVENDRYLREEGEVDEGRAVAVVRVATIRPFAPEDVAAACARSFEIGWLAWELVDIRPLQSQTPVKAARGLYELPVPPDAEFRPPAF